MDHAMMSAERFRISILQVWACESQSQNMASEVETCQLLDGAMEDRLGSLFGMMLNPL